MAPWAYEFWLLVLKVSLTRSLRSLAHSWEILLALEDKIRIPARPCSILYFLFCGRWREVQLYLKTVLSCLKVMNFLAFFTTRNCPTSAKEKQKKKTESRTRHRSGWAMGYNVSFKSIHHNRMRISLFRENRRSVCLKCCEIGQQA